MSRVGVMMVGALGNVAAVVLAGVTALRAGVATENGMVTDLPFFSPLDLAAPRDFVLGGWDIREGTPLQSVRRFAEADPVLAPQILSVLQSDPESLAADIFPGVLVNCGAAVEALGADPSRVRCGSLEKLLGALRRDIREFRRRHAPETVVVVNLASTEPPLEPDPLHETADGVAGLIAADRRRDVRAGTLYALAAIEEGCPYINFTPANAPLLPGVVRLAEARCVPVMGDDGKTGETLVKSALAPMFADRNLKVQSWTGFNILGNLDGRILENPENRSAKLRSKDGVLGGILGDAPHSVVGIDFVPSLNDQKIAWDFVHFEGFLGTRMSLQFVWQGYDSLLAAPLVLDLVRLAELAFRRGEFGLLPHLASFFKAPRGVEEHRFAEQFGMLRDYAARVAAEQTRRRSAAEPR